MAHAVTETHFFRKGGELPGLCMLVGTIDLDVDTDGTITPGNNDTNIPGSGSLREILYWGITNNTNSNAFKIVKSYDTTQDGDILTLTGTAQDQFNFFVVGYDSGADVD